MSTSRIVGAAVVAGVVLSASGCASVMSGRTAAVTMNSNVPDARVVVRDMQGREVASTHTPATLELERKERFAVPANYTATFEAPGYQPTQVPIQSTMNPWLIGNLVAGGLIGLAVDNATGAAWTPAQSSIYGQLEPLGPGASSLHTAERSMNHPVHRTGRVY